MLSRAYLLLLHHLGFRDQYDRVWVDLDLTLRGNSSRGETIKINRHLLKQSQNPSQHQSPTLLLPSLPPRSPPHRHRKSVNKPNNPSRHPSTPHRSMAMPTRQSHVQHLNPVFNDSNINIKTASTPELNPPHSLMVMPMVLDELVDLSPVEMPTAMPVETQWLNKALDQSLLVEQTSRGSLKPMNSLL